MSDQPISLKDIRLKYPDGKLRNYQADVVFDVIRNKGSVLVEVPTGGGKTFVSMAFISELLKINSHEKILFIAPRKVLISQTMSALKHFSPQLIHGTRDYDRNASVFVSTNRTASRRDLGFTPTVIVIDEIHIGFSGKDITKLLEGFTGKLIGLSATPYDKDGRVLDGFDFYSNKYGLNYMIKNKWLVPPLCFSPLKVDLSKIKVTGGDYNLQSLSDAFSNKEAILDVVLATKKKIKDRKGKCIVFCIDQKHAVAMAKAYTSAGLKAKPIHSSMSEKEIEKNTSLFESGRIDILTNPLMLTTGYDHPPIKTVVIARATKSSNLFIQMVGRGLRPSPSTRKRNCCVLDCGGVIGSLGLPTEPIQEKAKRVRRKREEKQELPGVEEEKSCPHCQSLNLYAVERDGVLVTLCKDCNEETDEVLGSAYSCEKCGCYYTPSSEISVVEGVLSVKCDSCSHITHFDNGKIQHSLGAIYDPSITGRLIDALVGDYSFWIVQNLGLDYLQHKSVSLQFQAFRHYASERPERLSLFSIEDAQKYEHWKIIPQKLEIKYLERIKDDVSLKKEAFMDRLKSVDFFLSAKGLLPISEEKKEAFSEYATKEEHNEDRLFTLFRECYLHGGDCNHILLI